VPSEINRLGIETFVPLVYLTESLTHCQESHVLVDLLKCDAYTMLSLSPAKSAQEVYIVDRISQYIKVGDTLLISYYFLLMVVLTIAL
jgi:hypothetical protein